jgi:putative ABC transport system substrate-binding protein
LSPVTISLGPDVDMKRRAFITLLGGAAVAWPVAARAQSVDRVRRVGILMAFSEGDPEGQLWASAFVQGLKELGWTEGLNAKFDWRWAKGDVALMGSLAKELVAHQPNVILASSSPVLAALKQATTTIPIVFVSVSNPVGAGFVQSLAHPGGNATGLANYEGEMASKWLAQLKEVSSSMTRVAVLLHPDAVAHAAYWRELSAAAHSLNISPVAVPFRNASEIERNLNTFAVEPHGGLVVLANIIATANRDLIIRLAAENRLPAIYPFRVFVSAGGLMSYGIDLVEAHRRVATYVDSVLRGASPADLPVQLQTKFTTAINLKTARALGLALPPTLLALADEVIE